VSAARHLDGGGGYRWRKENKLLLHPRGSAVLLLKELTVSA